MKYLREIVDGFISLLKGMKVTWTTMMTNTYTVQWPMETAPLSPRFRGHIILTINDNSGYANCIACGSCARICPSDCIHVMGEKPMGAKRKAVRFFMLDFTKCSHCGLCVESCPVDGLDFSKNYALADYHIDDFAHMDLMRGVRSPLHEEVRHV